MPANMTFKVILHQKKKKKKKTVTLDHITNFDGKIDKWYKIKGNQPLILGEPIHMPQTYDPCNSKSTPSLIKFL